MTAQALALLGFTLWIAGSLLSKRHTTTAGALLLAALIILAVATGRALGI